jgi:hypothetical protein
MTRDLEHPYLPGGSAAFFFALLPCEMPPHGFCLLCGQDKGVRMVRRYTTWEQLQPFLLLFALVMIGLFASLE